MLCQLLYSGTGPLQSPTNIPFNSPVVGSPVLFFVSGSGWSNNGQEMVGVNVALDGETFTSMQAFTNEATSHVSFVCAINLIPLDFGKHTLSLMPSPNTTTDSNDSFTVTMVY